jgi:hypothetical protein
VIALRAPALVAAAALLISACGGGDSSAPDARGNDRAAAPATSDLVKAAQDAQILSPKGWGPIRIGMTKAQVTAALGPDANPHAVGGPEPDLCDEYRPERAPDGMRVMIEGGRLARITLSRGAALRTTHGVSIGDAAEEVLAAGGTAAIVEPHKNAPASARSIIIWDGPRRAGYVDNPDTRGFRFETGEDGRVTQIHAGGPSIQYVEGCL